MATKRKDGRLQSSVTVTDYFTGEKKKIVFCLTGTGYFDLKAYSAYNSNEMTDYVPSEEDLQKGFATIPDIPQNR